MISDTVGNCSFQNITDNPTTFFFQGPIQCKAIQFVNLKHGSGEISQGHTRVPLGYLAKYLPVHATREKDSHIFAVLLRRAEN
jgi:hypothetical protein